MVFNYNKVEHTINALQEKNEVQTQESNLFVKLANTVQVSICDILCGERMWCHQFTIHSDPRLHILAVTHRNRTIFRKSYLDSSIPEIFWINYLGNFQHLIVLDLNLSCTDGILRVVGDNCSLLEEINIVSGVKDQKTVVNTSNVARYVTDAGLLYLCNLKRLRSLDMDSPRNQEAKHEGQHVTQSGIISLLCQLPHLLTCQFHSAELWMEFCDMGSMLIACKRQIGPLSLRKMHFHFASGLGIRKLLRICPHLRDLSVTNLPDHSKDEILEEITASEVWLNKLNISFFSYSDSLKSFLKIKGGSLTHLSIMEMDHTLSLEAILCIGVGCPNLEVLSIMTQNQDLRLPTNFQKPKNIFMNLRKLSLGNRNFNRDDLLLFFLECTEKMQKLELKKYGDQENVDQIFLNLLNKDRLKNIYTLFVDCTLKLSEEVMIEIIRRCDKLDSMAVSFPPDDIVYQYVRDNNFAVRLGSVGR